MYKYFVGLLLVVVTHVIEAAPIKPALPCERQVFVFGGATILAEGVRVPGSNDFASRMRAFIARVCGREARYETIAGDGSTLIGESARIAERLARYPRSVALIHFPASDIEAGASVEQLMLAYGRLLEACARTNSICVVGGQQPVNSFSKDASDKQRELERRATAAFGRSYLPLYRHFESESPSRRLMVPMDSGDGRFLDDRGHGLLYTLYRTRLLELARPSR